MIVDTEVTELAPHSTRAWKKEVGVVTPGSWEEHKGTSGVITTEQSDLFNTDFYHFLNLHNFVKTPEDAE